MWTALLKASTILSVGLTVKQLIEEYTCEVKANRIYSSGEAARFLGIERREVVDLIRNRKIPAKMVSGNYRIPGAALLEYLKQS
ncbi:MAG: excisionase family DNA-binding protein [Nitrospinae bacterium]|nr:excisionase family DNA-binding protein [Nitrospinota bacterium]